MNNYFYLRKLVCVILTNFFFFYISISLAKANKNNKNILLPTNPHYELKLNLNEFSFLNSALVDGLNKYSGNAELDLNISKEENRIYWTISINNQRLMEVLGIYIAEKSVSILKNIDIDNIDAKGKIAMKVAKSLSSKIDYAQKNPIWNLENISGKIIEESNEWFINGEKGKYKITGILVDELKGYKETPIVAYGFVKVKGQIEVTKFIKKRVNTLELFVMSLCPFGQKAEKAVIDFLENYTSSPKPLLEIHYLFYKKDGKENGAFTSLHGDEEVAENLLQIVIRDKYPEFFFKYIIRRARDNDIPWFKLVEDIGLNYKDIQIITNVVEDEREELIQKEYDYASKTYGIYDGSPTYVWESKRVSSLGNIEYFHGLESSSSESCSK